MFSTGLVFSFFITCTYVECLTHYHMQELSFSANCETLLCSLLSILIASYVVDAYFVAHFVNPIGCNLALRGVYCVWIKISFAGISYSCIVSINSFINCCPPPFISFLSLGLVSIFSNSSPDWHHAFETFDCVVFLHHLEQVILGENCLYLNSTYFSIPDKYSYLFVVYVDWLSLKIVWKKYNILLS